MKINLGVGAYRDDNGKPFILSSVREAEKRIFERNVDHEYAAIQGNDLFIKLSEQFVFGENSTVLKDNRVATVQCLSGTGSLRLFAECFASVKGRGANIYLPNPTWANHTNIFRIAGLNHVPYNYYDSTSCSFDIDGMLNSISETKEGDLILMHACAHNPTGCDPSKDQWKIISDAVRRKNLVVLFDNAYQGYSSGDPERDAETIRYFAESGHNLVVCQSYSKNFGLYGQRIGSLSVVTANEDEKDRVFSLLKSHARAMYSNPPIYGARIVAEILTSPDLKRMWQRDCVRMTQRIISMRSALRNHLEGAGSTKSWKHITDQSGMFCYSGLNSEQVDRLRDEYHIYCTSDGRISIAGVTSGNVAYLAKAIHEVTKE
eukprot:CAMPEP_0185019258 /NCGR_PEP_ID=MMETSP1103-20130426/1876_1 /TAXON_ID=36769 /ORGANISM="Paraphysomonas bandaiensis, Strain Caron Lab Isolate" /LENGTH=374 /DNA_ID=CAMNT_0027549465 /DNA_START=189 /DNA_END=1313 /DNA_ORIENTATION=-